MQVNKTDETIKILKEDIKELLDTIAKKDAELDEINHYYQQLKVVSPLFSLRCLVRAYMCVILSKL